MIYLLKGNRNLSNSLTWPTGKFFKLMKTIRNILAFISIIIIILLLLNMDYSDLSWAANKNNYLGVAICVLNIWALLFLIREKK